MKERRTKELDQILNPHELLVPNKPIIYIYIYVEGTFMYRMTVLEISIYHT